MRVSVLVVFRSVFIMVALAAVAVGCYAAYIKLPSIMEELTSTSKAPKTTPGQEVIVEIPKGASLSQVGTLLESKGVISSRLVFKLVAAIRGEQRMIQAGEYSLKTGSDAGVVLDQLISGKTLLRKITIPEGYNIFQIADLFEVNGIMSRDQFLAAARDKKLINELGVEGVSLEGYLFPDTYFVTSSEMSDGRKLIRRMVQRFREVYDNNVAALAKQYGWKMDRVVTLASLIEKEATSREHALVSAVFHNRIRKRMRLQSDPTVIYGIKPMGAKITSADLRKDHPYNTYVHFGLPPGPIANPGKASLLAAMNPADVNYLYFVATNDGKHHFSPDLKEHNRAVNRYQRGKPDPQPSRSQRARSR